MSTIFTQQLTKANYLITKILVKNTCQKPQSKVGPTQQTHGSLCIALLSLSSLSTVTSISGNQLGIHSKKAHLRSTGP